VGAHRPAAGRAAAKPAGAAAPTLRLRVTLLNVEPPVWREVQVPVDLTFADRDCDRGSKPDPAGHFASSRSTARRFFVMSRAPFICFSNSGP